MAEQALEKRFQVRGITLAGKLWRPQAPRKIIALHGWLDNAASFDVLAPLLGDCSVLALDLAGQGFSDQRPASATCHLWDDALDVLELADQLGWQQFALLGHSRGAMLSVMLAASLPERVQQLLLLDALMPQPVEADQAPLQLRRYLDSYQNPAQPRYFVEREQAIAFRARVSSIEPSLAAMLATRQLRQLPQGWCWQVDERLKSASAIKLGALHNQAFLDAVRCPVAVFIASRGIAAFVDMQAQRQRYTQFNWYETDGHHHVHMTETATEIAETCTRFMR